MLNFKPSDLDLPNNLVTETQGYKWEKSTIGWSKSDVFKLKHKTKKTLYLKVNNLDLDVNFHHEYKILCWLKNKLPVPDVICYEKTATHEFILMTEIEGSVAFEVYSKTDIETNLTILAKSLQMLHSIDIEDCPVEIPLINLFETAEQNLRKNLVKKENFDSRWKNRDPFELLDELKKQAPEKLDLVLTHGDYCLPNIIIKDGKLSGFIDLGTAGINDRYFDLAAATWSIGYNFGSKWVPYFFKEYGIEENEIDWERIHFYQKLMEFVELS